MTKHLVLVLVLATPARAESISVDAGASYLAFDLPTNTSAPAFAVALAAGDDVRRDVHLSLRGHLAIGDGHTKSLGPHVRHDLDTLFVGYGVAIASLLGPAAPHRGHGLGLTGELRVGAVFSSFTLAAHARPTWVFASDAFQADAHLDAALELGATLGVRL